MEYKNKIDFQAHYLPNAYRQFLEDEGMYCPDGFPTPEWDEEWQREAMRELGISYALLTLSSPSVYTGNKYRSRELARRINAEGAQIAGRSEGTLGFIHRQRVRAAAGIKRKVNDVCLLSEMTIGATFRSNPPWAG